MLATVSPDILIAQCCLMLCIDLEMDCYGGAPGHMLPLCTIVTCIDVDSIIED